jgi:hypothetical protein
MTLRFVEETHEYFLAEKSLLSVTEVLSKAGLLNYPASTGYHMERGAFVHRATEMIDKGTLDWDSLDGHLRPYCEAYKRFVDDVKPEIILSEKPMYQPNYFYAGTPDRVVKMNGLTTLIDIKSGSPHPATVLQVAAYADLIGRNYLEDIYISKAYVLYLRDDATYRLDEVKDLKRNLQIFLAALTVVRWREENL